MRTSRFLRGKEHLEEKDHHRDRHYAQDRRHDVVDTSLHRVFAAQDRHLDNGTAAGSAGADHYDQSNGPHIGMALHIPADIQKQGEEHRQHDEPEQTYKVGFLMGKDTPQVTAGDDHTD